MFSDVDSAYATIESNLTLLRPYKETYLKEAVEVRDTVSFAYTRGGASLLDFLQAQQDYRSTQLNYLNLVGSYLTAAAQLNMAVGQEVIPMNRIDHVHRSSRRCELGLAASFDARRLRRRRWKPIPSWGPRRRPT